MNSASLFARFNALSTTTRMTIGVFAALFVLLVGWYALAFQPDYVAIYSDLEPGEASSIVEELDEEGVHYRLANGGAQILAPRREADSILVHVAGSGAAPHSADGFELFDRSDMGLTDFDERVRYQRALQGEIARTIMMMDGVTDARVHLSMPERPLFRSEQRNGGAAVTLVTRRPEDASSERVAGIQRLVAAAAQNISIADVVVLNARGEIISPTPQTPTPSAHLGADQNPVVILAAEAIHAALPNRYFDISAASPIQPPTGAPGPIAEGASPRSRLVITTESSLSIDERDRVLQHLSSVSLLETDDGNLSFAVAPMQPNWVEGAVVQATTMVDPREMASRPRVEPPLPRTQPNWIVIALAAFIGLAVIIATLVALTRLREARPSLAIEEQQRFADELAESLRKLREESHEPA